MTIKPFGGLGADHRSAPSFEMTSLRARLLRRIRRAGVPSKSMGVACMVGLLLTLGLGPVPARAAEQACQSVKLTPKPYWVSSASWAPDGDRLLAVDSLTSRVLSYNLQGRQRDLTDDYRGLESFFPVAIDTISTPAGPRQLLQLTHGRFRVVPFGSASSLVSGFDAAPLPGEAPAQRVGASRLSQSSPSLGVEKLWQFALVGKPGSTLSERRLVGFSDVSHTIAGDKSWSFDLVSVPWGQRDRASVVGHDEFSPGSFDDPVRTYFRLGYPLIAALGTDVYILRMEESPKIFVLRGAADGKTDLEVLEGLDLGQRAELPGFERFSEDFPSVMDTLVKSASKVPVGLYSQGDLLYVLFRQRAEAGGTRWSLAAIDPKAKDGNLWRGEAVLTGVASDHLTVVPGSEHWAFLEKGPVVELFTEQDIPSMTLVATDRISQISAQARGAGLLELCP
ncbi:MAG: hypothetical protein KDD11_22895 [Acidobacteria bacterium]|nr:hypothetical protein [Acidobacteriota bacterium]